MVRKHSKYFELWIFSIPPFFLRKTIETLLIVKKRWAIFYFEIPHCEGGPLPMSAVKGGREFVTYIKGLGFMSIHKVCFIKFLINFCPLGICLRNSTYCVFCPLSLYFGLKNILRKNFEVLRNILRKFSNIEVTNPNFETLTSIFEVKIFNFETSTSKYFGTRNAEA